MKQLIECVPNISKGCNQNFIKQVVVEIEKVDGIRLIDVERYY